MATRTRGSFRPAIHRLVEKGTWPEELSGLRFHDLRHTYASYLVAIGAHPKQMAEVMGHSSVQITLDRYAHLFPHLLDALTKRLDKAYKDVKPPKPKTADVVPMRS
jgi:integrase